MNNRTCNRLNAFRILAMFVAVSIASATCPSDASANAAPGLYFGAGVGSSNVSVYDSNDPNGDCCDYTYESGDSDTSFSAHIGYRIMPYLAIEAGYLNAGEPNWHESFVYIPELNDFFDNSVDVKLQTAELSVLAILPFGRIWEGYARVGGAYWWADSDQTAIREFDGALFTRSVHDDDAGFLLGLGIGVSPVPHWNFRVEVQTYTIDEDLLNANGDASLDSILFEVEFRPRG